MRFSVVCARLIAAVAACAAIGSWAQPYPTKPIRIIVPFAVGGTTDLLSRAVGAKRAAALGQPVIADNRSGAGWVLGQEIVAKAPRDAHASGMLIRTHAVQPGI